MKRRPRWTPEETSIAKRLIAEGATDEQCIAIVGRTRHACWTKLDNDKKRAPPMNHVAGARPKPEMLEEAYRRAAAPRTITAFICGDPGAGYSALDRREERV